MNFKNGGVQIWQNVCIAAKALHSDTMFPTPTAKPAEPGSLISERSAPLSTESTRQFRSVPVAFARARSKEAENASRRKNIRKPLQYEGASLPSSYSVTILSSKSLLCKSSETFESSYPHFENDSIEYSKKCILSVFWQMGAFGFKSVLYIPRYKFELFSYKQEPARFLYKKIVTIRILHTGTGKRGPRLSRIDTSRYARGKSKKQTFHSRFRYKTQFHTFKARRVIYSFPHGNIRKVP